MDRDDLGSWLSGPRVDAGGADAGYPGERLGLAESGVGSVSRWGPRIGAVFVDWFIALGVTLVLIGPPEPGDGTFSVVVLAVFAVEYVVLLLAAGRTIGMALAGVRVLPIGRGQLGVTFVLLRTLLLTLVIPAVVYDRDRRGLHDRAGRTAVVRTR
jgi:uncharacterized RDD family membrane protein YckC